MREVEVPVCDEEATTKRGTLEREEVAFTDRSPQGDVVAMPTLPAKSAVEVAVRVPTVRLPMVDEETSSLTKAIGDEVAE
jgi:hypothetical protein